VSYTTNTQSFVRSYNLDTLDYYQFPLQAGIQYEVTDVDILGSYLFISQPLLYQVSVYWFNPPQNYPSLYMLNETSTNDWPGFQAEGDWQPIAVWGHSKLPNLIYIEMDDIIVSVAISFSNPIYVNIFNLDSLYTDPNWSRYISVTPFVLVVAEVYNNPTT